MNKLQNLLTAVMKLRSLFVTSTTMRKGRVSTVFNQLRICKEHKHTARLKEVASHICALTSKE